MLRQVIQSSSIRSIGYDAHQRVLEVEFAHGSVYRYLDVPAEVWTALRRAPSKGGYFHEHVRDAFLTERVA